MTSEQAVYSVFFIKAKTFSPDIIQLPVNDEG